MVPLKVAVAAAVTGGRLRGGSAVHRLSAWGWDRSAGQPCEGTPMAGRRSKGRRMCRLAAGKKRPELANLGCARSGGVLGGWALPYERGTPVWYIFFIRFAVITFTSQMIECYYKETFVR